MREALLSISVLLFFILSFFAVSASMKSIEAAEIT